MSAIQPIIVVLYCRTATDGPEARTKLEHQEAACRAYCEENGLTVGMVHYEVSSGDTYCDRERLGLMRTRYRDGSIQGVVVSTFDRLSRSHVHLIILVQKMEAHDVEFHCASEDAQNSPTGIFLRTVVDVIAEVERQKALDPLLAD